jgi:RNA polymerase sigma factor (sigma-70 family)
VKQDYYARARAGHPIAVEAVMEALEPRLTRMAYYYGHRCQEDPDDLLQEARLGLLHALPELDIRIGSPDHYLIQRARWRLLDAIKRAQVRRCSSLDDTVGEDQVDPIACAVSDAAVARAWTTEFTEQLQTMQRLVLACLLRGLTWREAGEALGCTSANIAYHVRQIQRRYETWER